MADYTVGSGQTRFGLVLHPNDTATVASGGTVVGTTDGGAVTLNGGRSIFTAVLGGGSERIENGGAAFGTLVENGSISVVSGSVSDTFIAKNGILSFGNPAVSGEGTSDRTIIDGGSEAVYGTSSAATNTLIENGGNQSLYAGTTATNTLITSGGQQQVLGLANNTVVDNGGLQSLNRADASSGASVGTIVNNGGKQWVNGGVSNGTVINPGGIEDVVTSASGTVINGGTMIVEDLTAISYPGITGGIRFSGHNGLLEFAGTALTTTPISGFAPTDRIDFMRFGYNNAATATLGANNVLTIQGLTGGTVTFALDPAANYSGESFNLASDGQGGTNLTVQNLGDLRAAASAQGDPLGLQAAFTKTVPAAALPASASGMMLPDPVFGSADALAVLTQASAHGPILASHDMAASG